jgi:ABC-type taurine transport system ATPase subunit
MMWLDIEAREFLTLLGPSGCGKSTLLNILAGFERPDSGKVLLNGVPIERPGPDRGVVFQDYALFPWLNIQQNVQYGLREKGMDKAESSAVAQRFLAMVGLSGFERRFPHELSGGMRQRVALIRVLALRGPLRPITQRLPVCPLSAAKRTSPIMIWACSIIPSYRRPESFPPIALQKSLQMYSIICKRSSSVTL